MTSATASTLSPYLSLHDQRVRIVATALSEHSDLGDVAALALAGHAVHALDHIPEKVR